MTRARLVGRTVLAGAVVAATLVAAPPGLADERNVRLHSAAFGGYGKVTLSGEGLDVEVRASGGECTAVVVPTGGSSLVVPCTFRFGAPVVEPVDCTGIASGTAVITVSLPSGHAHDFTYPADAIVDETTIHGFGSVSIDHTGAVRVGWVKFDATRPVCVSEGLNAGTALY